MAMSKELLSYVLTADAAGMITPVSKATGALRQMGDQGVKSGQQVAAGLEKAQQGLHSFGNKASLVGAGMTAAISLPLTAMLKSGLDALVAAETRAAQTNAVIKSTGGAANVSADHLKKLVTGLRDMSGVSGSVITNGANMLLTFTQIRNRVGEGNNIFDQATEAVLNMSVALGEDSTTAAIRLGKALNDPVAGMTALKRVGVTFLDDQKKIIEGFVRQGDVVSAQKEILKELNVEFGGQARAFGETTAAAAQKAQTAFMLIKMDLAAALLPALKSVAEGAQDVGKWFQSLDEDTQRWIGYAAVGLAAGGPLLTGVGLLAKSLAGLVGLYQKLAVSAAAAGGAQRMTFLGGGALLKGLGGAAAGFAIGELLGGDSARGRMMDAGTATTGAASALGMAGGGPAGVLAAVTAPSNPRWLPTDQGDFDQWIAEIQQASDELGGDQQKLANQLAGMGSGLKGSREALDSYRETLERTAKAHGLVIEWSEKTRSYLGSATVSLVQSEEAAQQAASAEEQHAVALQKAATAAQAAGFNMQALGAALEGTFTPWLQGEQAALALEAAFANVDDQIKAVAESEQKAADKGVAVQQVMFGLVSGMGTVTQQFADGNITVDKYNEYTTSTLEKLDDLAKTGYPNVREAADTYRAKLADLQQMGIIQNGVELQGVEAAKSQAEQLLDVLRKIQGMGGIEGSFASGIEKAFPQGARGGTILDGVARFARGGVFNRPTAIVGEGSNVHEEYVIPTDPKYRDRAMALWERAGSRLMAAGGAVGGDGAAASSMAGPAAESTDALGAFTGGASAGAAASAELSAQLGVLGFESFPASTQATVLATQMLAVLTGVQQANLPAQMQEQQMFAETTSATSATTQAVMGLIAQLQTLNATAVTIQIDRSQVDAAAGSLRGLTSAVSSALGTFGLDGGVISQWLGVVLALPSGTLGGAVTAESGGYVGRVGSGFTAAKPTLVGEGNPHWREYVIPTDPAHRTNALNLLGGLHGDLGIPAMAGGGILGRTPWGGVAASAPGALLKATSGSMIAAAAAAQGGGMGAFVDWAQAQAGKPYVWAAAGPDTFDCSGLIIAAAAANGLPGLPHYSGSLIEMASPIPLEQGLTTPGALLWKPGHIAISRGDGTTIEARGKDYGVGNWPAEGRFVKAGLLSISGGTAGAMSDSLPPGWREVGQFIADKFAAAGIGPKGGGGPGDAGEGTMNAMWTGRISTFGGPGDFQPMASGIHSKDAYYQDIPFAAMRLAYGGGDIPLNLGDWINIGFNGTVTNAQLLDWGPAAWANRLVDVSPTVMDRLGAVTDDIVEVGPMASGGIVGVYDQGGYLPEGLSLAYNGTGRPEPVGLASGVTVNVHVEGNLVAQEDLVDQIADAITSRARRGFSMVG